MNTHVDFETARLLSTRGFVCVCEEVYRSDGQLYTPQTSGSKLAHSNFLNDGSYSAPTIAEVVMWLYKRHGIWIFADFGLGWEGFVIPCGYYGSATHEELNWNGMRFESPTEAYLAAIKYVLQTIIK